VCWQCDGMKETNLNKPWVYNFIVGMKRLYCENLRFLPLLSETGCKFLYSTTETLTLPSHLQSQRTGWQTNLNIHLHYTHILPNKIPTNQDLHGQATRE
jgi:hypothetical protein